MTSLHSVRQAVEAFHLAFVGLLGTRLDKSLYAIKGGANLRFFYGSPRYSEDIDFDVQTVAPRTLRSNVERLLKSPALGRQLAVARIEIGQWSAPKQTDTTQRWKVRLVVGSRTQLLPTKIEFSRRGLEKGTEFGPVLPTIVGAHGLPAISAPHYGMRAAFFQKVGALAGRRKTQARDVFDLDHLLSSGLDPANVPATLKRRLRSAIDNASSVTFDDFKGQVLSFLPTEAAAAYDARVWDDLAMRVVERLSELT